MNPSVAEVISSTLIAFPCPPLPMLGGRKDGKEVIINTHDLLANFMINLLKIQDDKINRVRKQLQMKLEKEYFDQIQKMDDDDVEKIYGTMARYTMNYMHLYFPDATLDIRILPMDHVPDDLLQQVAHYVRGRQILLEQTPTPMDDFVMKPTEMYRVCHNLMKKIK